jgi:hypothetical protein
MANFHQYQKIVAAYLGQTGLLGIAWASMQISGVLIAKGMQMLPIWHKYQRKPVKTCGNQRKCVDKAPIRVEGGMRNDSQPHAKPAWIQVISSISSAALG